MSETWIRAARALPKEPWLDQPKEPWHLVVSWLSIENSKVWTTACGQTINYDVEETRDRETVEHETTCFNCYTILVRELLREAGEEISDAPLAEDYEPQVLDPSHVTVDRGYGIAAGHGERAGTMETPVIDPDQERRAYVAGWLTGARSPFTAMAPPSDQDQQGAIQAYLSWKADQPLEAEPPTHE